MLDTEYLKRLQIRERGWSERMIAKLLDTEDTRLTVNHWRNYTGASAYRRDRVLASELSPDFEPMFRAWVKRAGISRTRVERFRQIRGADQPEAARIVDRGLVRVGRAPLFAFCFDLMAEALDDPRAREISGWRLSHWVYGRRPGADSEIPRLSMSILCDLADGFGDQRKRQRPAPEAAESSLAELQRRFVEAELPHCPLLENQGLLVVRRSGWAATLRRRYRRSDVLRVVSILQALLRRDLAVDGLPDEFERILVEVPRLRLDHCDPPGGSHSS